MKEKVGVCSVCTLHDYFGERYDRLPSPNGGLQGPQDDDLVMQYFAPSNFPFDIGGRMPLTALIEKSSDELNLSKAARTEPARPLKKGQQSGQRAARIFQGYWISLVCKISRLNLTLPTFVSRPLSQMPVAVNQ